MKAAGAVVTQRQWAALWMVHLYQSTNQSISQSVGQSVSQAVSHIIHPSSHPSIYPSIHQSVSQSISQSISRQSVGERLKENDSLGTPNIVQRQLPCAALPKAGIMRRSCELCHCSAGRSWRLDMAGAFPQKAMVYLETASAFEVVAVKLGKARCRLDNWLLRLFFFFPFSRG